MSIQGSRFEKSSLIEMNRHIFSRVRTSFGRFYWRDIFSVVGSIMCKSVRGVARCNGAPSEYAYFAVFAGNDRQGGDRLLLLLLQPLLLLLLLFLCSTQPSHFGGFVYVFGWWMILPSEPVHRPPCWLGSTARGHAETPSAW